MKKRTKVIVLAFLGLFALLFVGRFLYDVLKPESARTTGGNAFFGMTNNMEISQSSSAGWTRKNYASSKIKVDQAGFGSQTLEQKYERISSLSASSERFDEDSRAVNDLAKGLNAVVQSENAYGLAGGRALSLVFGVTPENFEALTEGLKKVGKLGSVTVTKTDKTGDFKALEAKRLSLEKTRDGLRALKVPGAALSDLVSLETKILEIEGQIQELGVNLGDYDAVNSMCTVNYSLSERAKSNMGGKIAGALFESLGWSLLVYLGIAAGAGLTFGAAILLSKLVDALRGMAKREGGGA
jgi:hypothetical protein